MPGRNTSLKKIRRRFGNASELARINPDALGRNLLRWRMQLTSNQQRREMWHLLQNVGGDAVVKRAAETISNTRSNAELEAVLRAAAADLWYEVGPALSHRFHREVRKVSASKPDLNTWARLHAMAFAAGRLGLSLSAHDVRTLLKANTMRLRSVGAEIVALQERKELLDDCLPLSWQTGDAELFAAEAVGKMGGSQHAALIWSHALSARRHGRQRLLRHLLHTLGNMGAFDIQVALRFWIQEDFAAAETHSGAWHYGTVWSRLVAAKLTAGACTTEEAVSDLRWFLEIAARDNSRGFGPLEAEHGPFDIAQQLVRLGATREAEELLSRFASRGLPSPAAFPDLIIPAMRRVDGLNDAWLAVLGDAQAQSRIDERWTEALNEARLPEHWEIRQYLDRGRLIEILTRSIESAAPGVLRQILGLLSGDKLAADLKPTIESLSGSHRSRVVRWKARRLLSALAGKDADRATRSTRTQEQRWVRMDAAILAGAMRPAQLQRHVARSVTIRRKNKTLGIKPPLQPGRGYRLDFERLSATARQETVKALVKGPLSQALDRRLPLGPSLEDRPDIKAVREPAPPHNEIDERMADLARAVMSLWTDGEEGLTLDEDGIQLVAAGLCADVRIMDDDDVAACGAFIGEALRKRLGGEWTGFDDNYRLEIGDEVFDPIGWARTVYARKDVYEGTRLLIENFAGAISKMEPSARRQLSQKDAIKAFENAIVALGAMPAGISNTRLLAEARVYAFRLNHTDWPAVLAALEPLIEASWVRVAAALSIYAPGDAFCKAWARWGKRRREDSGMADAIVAAMQAAAERDDLEAMPNWTFQPAQSRLSFLNVLRKRMPSRAWRKVLQLLLRQRAAAGDFSGTGWCLYSYKYEYPDSLPLLQIFCDMSVSARQTMVKATLHCTRDEQKLFRALWAEALRDAAPAVVLATLEVIAANHARSLRPLVYQLRHDKREIVSAAAEELLRIWEG